MKIKTLLYCTKALPNLLSIKDEEVDFMCNYKKWLTDNDKKYKHCSYNGKIVCECEVDTEELTYCKDTFGYVLHLSNVKERVMKLSECYTKKIERIKVLGSPYFDTDSVDYYFEKREVLKHITKAPQNMMWVYVKENGKWVKYLLISVRPQWLVKILNKEKDIEVRRKVLKGMCD